MNSEIEAVDKNNKVGIDFDIRQIMTLIPHRFPMLLIDRIENAQDDEQGIGIKNLTMNEPFFQGHFPDRPVMPGVLLIEAMAQVAAVLVMHSLGVARDQRLVYFMSIESARFRKPLFPGDTLRIPVVKKRKHRNVWKYEGKVYNNGVLAAEAVFSAMLIEE